MLFPSWRDSLYIYSFEDFGEQQLNSACLLFCLTYVQHQFSWAFKTSVWMAVLKSQYWSHFLRSFLNFLTLLRLTLLHCKFLKIFSDGIISEMMEKNLPFGVRQRNQRSNCQHPLDHWKSKRVPEKHLLLLCWLCQSLWLCRSQQTVENSERDGNTGPPDLPLEKSVCSSGSNS